MRRLKTSVLVELVAFFVGLSVVAAHFYAEIFHLPVIAALGTAFAAMVYAARESTYKEVLVYSAVAVGLNCLMVYIAREVNTESYLIALSGTILFTGLAGLLVLARSRPKLSMPVKAAILLAVVAVYVTSIKFRVLESEGIQGDLRLWLFAAIAPLTFLTVMTLMVLFAYHRRSVTVPPDKWV